MISSQETGTSSTTTKTDGSALGSCLTDSFHITSPGNIGSPTICGTNTGYHSKHWSLFCFLNIYKLANIFQSEYLVILDADTMCQYASFSIAPSTSTSRSWEIKVTQYACGNEDKAGS